ncbi:ABC transporter permease [Clostridium polynesiense]|uniref:ABC transporter permease n=1 Tax=Clostridium polynesiense TaxID=1325933 RepID=UPI00058E3B9A|nr:ABC transporter permease [Clostridium polynesiense]
MSEKNYSREHEIYLKKSRNSTILLFLSRILLLVFLIILWEIAAKKHWIDPFLTSSPTRILNTFVSFCASNMLLKHILVTCYETIVGFTLGTILGTFIATLLWWSDFAYKVLDPYLVVLNALPKVALGPIIIFWAGNGTSAIIVIALLISIIVTVISILAGFKEVNEDKIKLLTTFGADKLQILIHLIFPASIPTFISALKINVGLSWVGVIMGEFLVAKEGLGFLIVYGGQIAQLDMVMMSIIILSILAFLMYIGVAKFEKSIAKKY